MIAIFRYQHMRQQPCSGHAPLDRTIRSRLLQNPIASCAAAFWTHDTDHLKLRWHVLQNLRHIFTQRAETTAAIRTYVMLGGMCLGFSRKMPWQRTARSLAPTGFGLWC